MTEQKIQQKDTNDNSDLENSSSFWPFWVIFFFGVNFAALNWWRMGKKHKAIVFLAVFNLFVFVRGWFNVRNSSFADIELTQAVFVTDLVCLIILQILLITTVSSDQEKFEQSGKTPIPIHWTIILKFFAITLVLVAVSYCIYDLPVVFGNCGVPRFPDVVYQIKLDQRTGLEKIFLSRKDFDCNLKWLSESIKTENLSDEFLKEENISGVRQANTYHVSVDYGKSTGWGDFMGIDQTIFVLAKPVASDSFALLMKGYTNPTLWVAPDTSAYDLNGVWIQSRCRDYEDLGNRCVFWLADQSMVVKLSFVWHGDVPMKEQMKQSIEKTAYRMLQYNQSP